jgi:hypothetical protein
MSDKAVSPHKMQPATITFHSPAPLALTERCGDCGGCGFHYSDAWHAWFDRSPNERGPEPDEPEECPCSVCDGAGRVLTARGEEVAAVVRLVMAGRAGVGA